MQEEKLIQERRKGAWKKYKGWGLMGFCVIAASIFLVFIFFKGEAISKILQALGKAISPVVIGAVFAYLMNPLMKSIESFLHRTVFSKAKNKERTDKTVRSISIFITLILVIALIAFLVYLLVPELVRTISGMINNFPTQAEAFMAWYETLAVQQTWIGETVENALIKATDYFNDFINSGLLNSVTQGLGYLASGIFSVFGIVYNVIIGLIFSIYMLGDKDVLCRQAKKFLFAHLSRKNALMVVEYSSRCHHIFTHAIAGKILDSAIIGVLCFILMSIFKLPYATLVSVLVGVTNVIPFFGPYFGAVPSAILILFVNPMQCVYFLILILCLQQFDGNFLGPKVVGEKVGLSPFWVLFACVVFGSLFGVAGMLLGVPVTACAYVIIKDVLEHRLYKRGLRTQTADYDDVSWIDETEMVRIVTESADNDGETAQDEKKPSGTADNAEKAENSENAGNTAAVSENGEPK